MVAEKTTQKSILELFKEKDRTLSAEIIPPRNGSETEIILRQIDRLKKVPVDFISVTKGAGGSLRGGTLPIAQLIKERFQICSLAHFTCRDYTIEEIENNLVDHYYFGVKNILALRGDPPDGQSDVFKSAPNRHDYAWQLVQQISSLNQGEYISRKGYDSKSEIKKGTATDFCIGVAAHPEHTPLEQAVEFLKIKVDKGASFAITQMIYDADIYSRFLDACAKAHVHIPILPGVRVLTSAQTANRMKSKFGVFVPNSFIEKLEKTSSKEEARQTGLDLTTSLCTQFFKSGAKGLHAFVMNDEKTGAELLERFL